MRSETRGRQTHGRVGCLAKVSLPGGLCHKGRVAQGPWHRWHRWLDHPRYLDHLALDPLAISLSTPRLSRLRIIDDNSPTRLPADLRTEHTQGRVLCFEPSLEERRQ